VPKLFCSNSSLQAPMIPRVVQQWRCVRCGTLHDRGKLERQDRAEPELSAADRQRLAADFRKLLE
jgi:hypothetical protein